MKGRAGATHRHELLKFYFQSKPMLNVDIIITIIIIIGKRRGRIYLNNKKWMDKASQK